MINLKTMRSVMATCAVLVATSSVAKADIVLLGATPAAAFLDLGGQGFGSAPRMLTLQTNGIESGFETPIDVENGDAIDGANKSTTPLLTALGWNIGADVGIGLNSGQTGNSGLTLQSLVLRIYNGAAQVGTFSLASPITFTAADLALQQGNGNAVFAFGLDLAQQAQFDAILAMSGSSGFRAGLGATLGCAQGAPAACEPSNDGPDSFLGFDRNNTSSVPDGGVTLMLLGGALTGLEILRRKFRS